MSVDVTAKLFAQAHLPANQWFDAIATVKLDLDDAAPASEPFPIEIGYAWEGPQARCFSIRERYEIPINKTGTGARVYFSMPDGLHITWFSFAGMDQVREGGTYVIIPGDNNGWQTNQREPCDGEARRG